MNFGFTLPFYLERVTGFEPATATLATWDSTTELHPQCGWGGWIRTNNRSGNNRVHCQLCYTPLVANYGSGYPASQEPHCSFHVSPASYCLTASYNIIFAVCDVFKQNPTPGIGIKTESLFRISSTGTPDSSWPKIMQVCLLKSNLYLLRGVASSFISAEIRW